MADTDVQINANDLINAFTKEASELLRRAVIAEQKFSAAAVEVDRLRREVSQLRTTVVDLQNQPPVETVITEVVEPKTATRKRPSRTRST